MTTPTPNTPQRKKPPPQASQKGAAGRDKPSRKLPAAPILPATPPKPTAAAASTMMMMQPQQQPQQQQQQTSSSSKRRKTAAARMATVATSTEDMEEKEEGGSMGGGGAAETLQSALLRRSARQQQLQQQQIWRRRWQPREPSVDGGGGGAASAAAAMDVEECSSSAKQQPQQEGAQQQQQQVAGQHDEDEPALSSERRALGLTGLLAHAASGDAGRFASAARRVGDDAKAWSRTDVHGRGVLHLAAAAPGGGGAAVLRAALASKMLPVDQEAAGTGATALTYALARRDLEAAVLLLVEGADPGKIELEYGQFKQASKATTRSNNNKRKAPSSSSSSSSSTEGPQQQQEQRWAARLGLEQAAPRSEVLVLLRQALREAMMARSGEPARPWLDGTTQRRLFEGWQRGLKPGSLVDARDCDGKWYEAVVTAVVTDHNDGKRRGGDQEEEEMEEEDGGSTTAGAKEAADDDGIPGQGVFVRVSYRCWGPKFDEYIPLSSLRVLPAYSVVPCWRDALTVDAHVEILSSASLAAAAAAGAAAALDQRPGVGGEAEGGGRVLPERKWWDASVKCMDRPNRRALLSVDGRAGYARWVSLDGMEVSDIGTHMKPQQQQQQPQAQQPLPPQPSQTGKAPLPPTARQLAAQEAAAARDLPTLLSLISVEDPGALRLQYFRQKLGLIAAYRPDGPTKGQGCPLLTARRASGKPEVVVKERRVGNGASYAETRKGVLQQAMQLPDCLFRELLTGYWQT